MQTTPAWLTGRVYLPFLPMAPGVGGGWSNGMRVVTHKNGMVEMSRINVIFLTNVENCAISLNILLRTPLLKSESSLHTGGRVAILVAMKIEIKNVAAYLCSTFWNSNGENDTNRLYNKRSDLTVNSRPRANNTALYVLRRQYLTFGFSF